MILPPTSRADDRQLPLRLQSNWVPAFRSSGRAPEANPAANKAVGVGQPVTTVIAVAVKGDKVSRSINNNVVATYDRSAVVFAGKLNQPTAPSPPSASRITQTPS
jgi:hypothetical protein